jgi:ABC-type protease/lipase transport system fused ATPase/permease subunit
VGIIGPSASGKSSLARALVGVWTPVRGKVRLDGAALEQWSSEQLGRHIGYLPQDVELFAGTVGDNVARMQCATDPELIVEAAQIAGVHEMIFALPKGYDTEIGEAGSFLSGGQRQRIGLARALFGRPRVVVLDEPSASLDSAGEEALVQAMFRAKEWGATVVLVAHQPRLLAACEKLLVLRSGKVEAFGARDEVFAHLRQARPPERAPAVATATFLRPIRGRAEPMPAQAANEVG